MIRVALVFDDPTMLGLPRGRGILAPMDANASTRQNALARDAHEASVLNGCLSVTSQVFQIQNSACIHIHLYIFEINFETIFKNKKVVFFLK
jgi:hypothetical protein